MVRPTGFDINQYDTDYKHLNFIQFRIMPPIMPPFYFVTQKLKSSGSSFPKATSIAKISTILKLLQIMKRHLKQFMLLNNI